MGVSRILGTSKVDLFKKLVNGFQPLTYVTKNSVVHVAGVLDPPLKSVLTIMHKMNVCSYLPSRTILCYVGPYLLFPRVMFGLLSHSSTLRRVTSSRTT